MNSKAFSVPILKGYTLAELITALAIYGLLATFTIQKILTTQRYAAYNANLKEMMSTVAQAYERFRNERGASSTATAYDLLPYINYVRQDTSSTVQTNDSPTHTCDNGPWYCYVMHNGGILLLFSGQSFGGTSNLHAIAVLYDPDGSGPVMGCWMTLYYNGRITTLAKMTSGTVTSLGPESIVSEPSWVRYP
jgi:prepilin-type N-terminal cleavage/methylation domain-containing protein